MAELKVEQKNPLREWRGKWDLVTAAIKLDYCFFDYLRLENEPQNVHIDTDMIFHIQDVTRIPLPALVDWLTETTKEMA